MNYPGNCYSILQNIRYAINEHSTALVQGTDTTGAFQNSYLITQINRAQYQIYSILFAQFPDTFLTSSSLSFSDSTASLPADCFKVREIRDSENNPLTPINVGERTVGGLTGSQYAYYRQGNTVRIDKSGVSDTATLYYYTRCREITCGMSSAGGALSLTLASTARGIVDYYNGMTIENITDNWVDTITDYTAARVCTLAAQTGAASKYYGIVSELPEIFHHLITRKAEHLAMANIISPSPANKFDLVDFNEDLRTTLISFAGINNSDVDIDRVINDFGGF
jgi:hypothetical protein